jgi:metal-sulfur cluster biosynthetic enzyme
MLQAPRVRAGSRPPAIPTAESMRCAHAVPRLGVEKMSVNLAWTPPWGPERISEEARLELGML